jgi:hypothetical protein
MVGSFRELRPKPRSVSGLNSTVAGLATHPFNPFDEFKGEFRVIAADLRNAANLRVGGAALGLERGALVYGT